LLGTEIWTKIFRKGEDIGYLFRNRNYDFNYQNNYMLNPYVNITRDDELVTYCRYNTSNRDKYSKAGHRTRDEVNKFIIIEYKLNNIHFNIYFV
jgi:hypothetical protein